MHCTGWPRKNATTLIVNFNDMHHQNGIDFYFIYEENSFSNKMTTMISWLGLGVIRESLASAILVRQCHFQNLVLFRPHRTLEHSQDSHLTSSRSTDRALALKRKTIWTNGAIHYAAVDSPRRVKQKFLSVPWIARVKKVANLENDTASLK